MVLASAIVAFEALFVLCVEALARLRSGLEDSAMHATSTSVWLAPVAVTLVAVPFLGWPADPPLAVLVSILIPGGVGTALMWLKAPTPLAVAVAIGAALLGLLV